MASKRASRPEVTSFAGKANSLAPEASTIEARLSHSAGSHDGE
jgi:hypothetical protein